MKITVADLGYVKFSVAVLLSQHYKVLALDVIEPIWLYWQYNWR